MTTKQRTQINSLIESYGKLHDKEYKLICKNGKYSVIDTTDGLGIIYYNTASEIISTLINMVAYAIDQVTYKDGENKPK